MYKPQTPKTYKGKQVIISSDRLVFNAKEDSILLYADKAIGFSTGGSIHFDTSPLKEGDESENSAPGRFVVNAQHIYLGLLDGPSENLTEDPSAGPKFAYPLQRAVLGNNMREYIRDLIEMMFKLVDDLYDNYSVISAEPGEASAPNVDNKLWMDTFKEELLNLKNNLSIKPPPDGIPPSQEHMSWELGPADDCSFLSKTVKLK